MSWMSSNIFDFGFNKSKKTLKVPSCEEECRRRLLLLLLLTLPLVFSLVLGSSLRVPVLSILCRPLELISFLPLLRLYLIPFASLEADGLELVAVVVSMYSPRDVG